MPDIAVIFRNRTVTGEKSCLCNVDKALAPPAKRIAGVVAKRLSLAHHIGVKVRQGLEPILVDQLILQTSEIFLMPCGQHLRTGQEIHSAADVRITLIPLRSNLVPGFIAMDDLIRALTEDINILLSDLLADLDIRAVHCAKRQRAVKHKLHVAGT